MVVHQKHGRERVEELHSSNLINMIFLKSSSTESLWKSAIDITDTVFIKAYANFNLKSQKDDVQSRHSTAASGLHCAV
jgi:hypothetical protein